MDSTVTPELQAFAEKHQLLGLTPVTIKSIQDNKPGFTTEKGHQFLCFQKRIHEELLKHKVITSNPYTTWFKDADLTEAQVRHFIIQFSVFSNLFLIAQLKKVINADSLEGMRASKEILANEIGVVFNNGKKNNTDYVTTEGSVEGGTFRFAAAHFEWLLKLCEKIDIGFNQVGKRSHGTKSTLFFCDELSRLYGNEDYQIAQAASFAVENWANAGFWKDLIQGLSHYKEKKCKDLPLGFFTWHDKIEAQHAEHTQEELEEYYFEHTVDEDAFIKYGNEMLVGVWTFWDGLNQKRE
jgi:hypothetical protein